MSRRFDKWHASIGLLYGHVYGHLVSNWEKIVLISKRLVLFYAFMQFLLFDFF